MDPFRLWRFAYTLIIRTLVQSGCPPSPRYCPLFLSFPFLQCYTSKLSLCMSPSVLQSITHIWPSDICYCLLSFILYIWEVCLSCEDAGRVSDTWSWLSLSLKGVLESFQGHGCLLAGWQLVNYCHQTKLRQGAWISRPTVDLHRYGLHVSVALAACWPACRRHRCINWSTLPLFISPTHTYKHMLLCWCKSSKTK